MSRPLIIKPASTVTLEQFASAYNAAFAGYFYPISADGEMLARRLRIEQVDLHHSFLAYDGDELLGTAMLAIRGEVGRLESLGLTPQYRGRGRSRELMDVVIEQARRCGLKRLVLEVLVHNTAALRLYQGAGLSIVRDLLLLERAAQVTNAHDTLTLTVAPTLTTVAAADLLCHFVRLHLERPQWTRDLPALLVMQNLNGLCLGDASQPEAYALFEQRPDGQVNIKDMAACDVGKAAELCSHLSNFAGPLSMFNEPESSIFIAPLQARGFLEIGRQHEMACEL